MLMPRAIVVALLVAVSPLLAGCLDVQATGLVDTGPSLAQAMMWSASFPILVVEVDAAPGVGPSAEHLAELQATLQDLTGRQRVVIYGPTTIDPPKQPSDLGDLARIHRSHADVVQPQRSTHVQGDVAMLHILYLPDRIQSEERANSAGVTLYDHGAITIFPETYRHLRQFDGGEMVSAEPALGRLVLLHEVGHALGLLDRGAPMLVPRADPDHPGHSLEPESIMSSGHSAQNGIIQGDLHKVFTPNDRADLAALAADDPSRQVQVRAG